MEAKDDVSVLVRAAADGDREAWNALVDRYIPLVWSVTRAYRLAQRDAEDVSQTVWLRLVEHLGDIREPRALPKWIMTTTKRESLRLLRAAQHELPVDPLTDTSLEAPDHEEVDAELLRSESHQALRDGLAELSAPHRELLLLLVADPPISYREISRLLDIPVGSIGPTRARCLDRLRATPAVRAFLTAEQEREDLGGVRNDLERVVRQR
jgi:RNA polymerase sigma factor (sigma-70 family)